MLELGLLERAALNLIEADGVHQKFCTQEPEKLTHVQFGDQDFLVARKHVAEIAGKWIEMAQMRVADAMAEFVAEPDALTETTVEDEPFNEHDLRIYMLGKAEGIREGIERAQEGETGALGA